MKDCLVPIPIITTGKVNYTRRKSSQQRLSGDRLGCTAVSAPKNTLKITVKKIPWRHSRKIPWRISWRKHLGGISEKYNLNTTCKDPSGRRPEYSVHTMGRIALINVKIAVFSVSTSWSGTPELRSSRTRQGPISSFSYPTTAETIESAEMRTCFLIFYGCLNGLSTNVENSGECVQLINSDSSWKFIWIQKETLVIHEEIIGIPVELQVIPNNYSPNHINNRVWRSPCHRGLRIANEFRIRQQALWKRHEWSFGRLPRTNQPMGSRMFQRRRPWLRREIFSAVFSHLAFRRRAQKTARRER